MDFFVMLAKSNVYSARKSISWNIFSLVAASMKAAFKKKNSWKCIQKISKGKELMESIDTLCFIEFFCFWSHHLECLSFEVDKNFLSRITLKGLFVNDGLKNFKSWRILCTSFLFRISQVNFPFLNPKKPFLNSSDLIYAQTLPLFSKEWKKNCF